jgi:hypothetical protein
MKSVNGSLLILFLLILFSGAVGVIMLIKMNLKMGILGYLLILISLIGYYFISVKYYSDTTSYIFFIKTAFIIMLLFGIYPFIKWVNHSTVDELETIGRYVKITGDTTADFYKIVQLQKTYNTIACLTLISPFIIRKLYISIRRWNNA